MDTTELLAQLPGLKVIHFSGHGSTAAPEVHLEHDVSTLDNLRTQVASQQPVLVILDACHAGTDKLSEQS
jgi:hypothetical protein